MRISELIKDAIEILDLRPSDRRPFSKVDIQRIADLVGTSMAEEDLENCFQHLLNKKAVGSQFKVKYLINWWIKHFKLAEEQEDQAFSTVSKPFASKKHFSSQQRSPVIPRNKLKNPVLAACKNLTDYLDALPPDMNDCTEDPNVRKLISDCLFEFEKNPKARAALQKAYEMVEENHKSEHAKKGEEFSEFSKERLKTTKANRIQKLEKDVDFLMRNQNSTNAGASLYFLLSPSFGKPKKKILNPIKLKDKLKET